MELNRQEVLEKRSKGMTYHEISMAIAHNDPKFADKVMCMNGGVIDICEYTGEGYDEHGVQNLAIGVIKSAVDEYGRLYTQIMDKSKPSVEWQRACELANKAHANEDEQIAKKYDEMVMWYEINSHLEILEKWFFNDKIDYWLGLFDNDISKEIIVPSIKDDARKGRWVKTDMLEFDTFEEANQYRKEYQYLRDNFVVKKHKKRSGDKREYYKIERSEQL